MFAFYVICFIYFFLLIPKIENITKKVLENEEHQRNILRSERRNHTYQTLFALLNTDRLPPRRNTAPEQEKNDEKK